MTSGQHFDDSVAQAQSTLSPGGSKCCCQGTTFVAGSAVSAKRLLFKYGFLCSLVHSHYRWFRLTGWMSWSGTWLDPTSKLDRVSNDLENDWSGFAGPFSRFLKGWIKNHSTLQGASVLSPVRTRLDNAKTFRFHKSLQKQENPKEIQNIAPARLLCFSSASPIHHQSIKMSMVYSKYVTLTRLPSCLYTLW